MAKILQRLVMLLSLLLAAGLAGGCAATHQGAGRPFEQGRDSFAFANELEWAYTFNEQTGKMDHHARDPQPAFVQRCFPVTIAARKFYYHARFDVSTPRVGAADYQKLAHQVGSRSQRRPSPEAEKIVIPGYANLHEFSRDHETVLKQEIGGKWRSYAQRGNWRMVFPFTRSGQARAAARLAEEVRAQRGPIIHLVTFPSLAINHVILLTGVAKDDGGWRFTAYDPNAPGQPAEIFYHQATRRFEFPRNAYFQGGSVNVYEVYRGVCF
jgi:hypothetical protein